MSNGTEGVFTRFKLGDPGNPIISGVYNQNHDYVFPAEFERPSPRKSEQCRVVVRLQSIQVFNRDSAHVPPLARWIAERRLQESFSENGLEELPAQFAAFDAEVEEFFRDIDPHKADQSRDRWIDLAPTPPTPKNIGF